MRKAMGNKRHTSQACAYNRQKRMEMPLDAMTSSRARVWPLDTSDRSGPRAFCTRSISRHPTASQTNHVPHRLIVPVQLDAAHSHNDHARFVRAARQSGKPDARPSTRKIAIAKIAPLSEGLFVIKKTNPNTMAVSVFRGVAPTTPWGRVGSGAGGGAPLRRPRPHRPPSRGPPRGGGRRPPPPHPPNPLLPQEKGEKPRGSAPRAPRQGSPRCRLIWWDKTTRQPTA